MAVSLLQDQVDTTDVNNPALYLTQQLAGVYTDPDPRTYPLSSYGYLILPTHGERLVHHGQGSDARRVLVLRHVPGPTAVGLPRLLTDAHQPGGGRLRPDRQDPRCRRAEHQHPVLQQPDVLPERGQPAGPDRPVPAGL